MALMDEFREEREEMRNRPLKDRLAYFWEYYKWHTIGGIAAVAFIGTLLYTILTAKEDALYATFINYAPSDYATELVKDPFVAQSGIDTSKYDVTLDSSIRITFSLITSETIAGQEKVAAMMAASQLDVLVAEDEVFSSYVYQDAFLPLDQYLTAEEMEKYKDRFLYIDRGFLAEVQALEASGGFLEHDAFPDLTDPSTMKDPVAIGIYLDGAKLFEENYYRTNQDAHSCAGIVINSRRPQLAHDLLIYLLES